MAIGTAMGSTLLIFGVGRRRFSARRGDPYQRDSTRGAITQRAAMSQGKNGVSAASLQRTTGLTKSLTRDGAPGVLITESGKRIPELVQHPSMFLDKTTVLYGPSKTGKTGQIKNMMKTIDGFCDEVLVVSPTELTNRSYDGYVDSPLVHYRIWLPDPSNPKKDDGAKGALRFLEFVWQRQEMKAAIFTRANNLRSLAALFGRIPRAKRAEGVQYLELLTHKRARVLKRVVDQYADDPAKRSDKRKEVNDKFKQMVILVYKKYIVPYYETLAKDESLSEDERYSLHYINFNPRLLLIFDDCAAQLKPLFAKEVFRKLFYQNRHSFITLFLAAQDDTDLPPNLKKNAFVSLFSEPIVTSSFFDRITNKFPKATKQFVAELIPEVFKGRRQLAYIREDDKHQQFYYADVPYHPPFLFGSNAVHELCSIVRAEGVNMDRENPFFAKFSV